VSHFLSAGFLPGAFVFPLAEGERRSPLFFRDDHRLSFPLFSFVGGGLWTSRFSPLFGRRGEVRTSTQRGWGMIVEELFFSLLSSESRSFRLFSQGWNGNEAPSPPPLEMKLNSQDWNLFFLFNFVWVISPCPTPRRNSACLVPFPGKEERSSFLFLADEKEPPPLSRSSSSVPGCAVSFYRERMDVGWQHRSSLFLRQFLAFPPMEKTLSLPQ